MDKGYLVEILKQNKDLSQDLSKNPFVRNELLGVLRNIELLIPEDSRQNFYTNLKTLRFEEKN